MIRQVAAVETHPLRQRVLRPHQALAEVGFPGDDDPETAHFAAFDDRPGDDDPETAHLAAIDAGGRIIGIATALRQPPDGALAAADPASWWRLRGMATAEDHRRRGVGAALLQAVVDHVATEGATALWCNARLSAVGFYRAAGFSTAGDRWDEPGIGPHVTMWRPIPGTPPSSSP